MSRKQIAVMLQRKFAKPCMYTRKLKQPTKNARKPDKLAKYFKLLDAVNYRIEANKASGMYFFRKLRNFTYLL